MIDRPIRVLVVEDNPDDAIQIHRMLSESSAARFDIRQLDEYDQLPMVLAKQDVDVVLLDMMRPDESKFNAVSRSQRINPSVPILMRTPEQYDNPSIQDIQAYFISGRMDGRFMENALKYAIERHQRQSKMEMLSLQDDLTGLFNRRGFLALASQQIKMMRREKKSGALLFIDVDDLKGINDTYGHPVGDRALMDTAEILRMTLRESDIIARFGGDEFIALAIDVTPENAGTIIDRLQLTLDDYNAISDRAYALSFSVGTAYMDPAMSVTLEKLIAEADRMLYRRKRRRSRGFSSLQHAV